MDVAINAAMIREEHLKVAFAVSHLGGRAKTWALTRANTLDASFPTWEYLQHELALTFQPPNSAYRYRSRFLACKQGKRELHEYVQELRTLISSMAADPLPEVVCVTILMEGMRVGPARTHLFRVQPETFEEGVRLALQEDYSQKQAKSFAGQSSNHGGAAPMDLSVAETTERFASVRCYTCGQSGHFQRNCPRNGYRKGKPQANRNDYPRKRGDGRGPPGAQMAPRGQGNGRSQ